MQSSNGRIRQRLHLKKSGKIKTLCLMELPKNYYQKYEFAQLSTFCSLSYIGFTASEDTTVHFGVDCILQQQVPGLKHTNANIVEMLLHFPLKLIFVFQCNLN